MIHYQLRCEADHAFDGWFRDSAAFDVQAKQGLLSCPLCGGANVRRALMAPAVRKRAVGKSDKAAVQAPEFPVVASAEPAGKAMAPIPDQVRAMLQRMRAEVEKSCDYVGNTFAEQARQMHDGDIDARPIYGEATPEQAQRLADDGIEVAQIPWVTRADS